MIRQLRRLTRPVPALGPDVTGLAVYAEAHGDRLEARVAAEQGYEGVACVDDAARAAVLYTAIWQRHHFAWARTEARGFLAFVGAMQDEAGQFANFLLDWDGSKNLTGPTSYRGGWPWTARAMYALARGVAAFGREDDRERFERGLPWLDRPVPFLDVQALSVLAALTFWQAGGGLGVAHRALDWAEQMASSRLGEILPDVPGCATIHLWGHLQEMALARVGQAFDRPDLVRLACRSADAILVPPVEHGFPDSPTLPFEVSSVVQGLDAVAWASGDDHYAQLANQARAWFLGRNPAGQPVYDRQLGRVYDGIDHGRVSANSGAEANIEGALALIDSLPWSRYAERLSSPSDP